MEIKKSNFQGLIPPDLIESIKNGKCILFVGSGLSAQINRTDSRPLPTWKNFLLELLDWSKNNGVQFWGDPNDVHKMIEKENYLMAAQELQERISNAQFGDFLISVFHEKSVKPSRTHRVIPYIPFRSILTTNFDSLIEGAYALERDGKLPIVFTQEDLLSRPSPLRKDYFFIFKIHGHIDRPSTIILGSRDYQELLFRTPGYRQFLETLFSIHTVLFVGFGMSDPDLTNIIDKLSTIYSRTLGTHYLLLSSGTFNQTEKRRFLVDKRIEIIEYKIDNGHSQLNEFLKELYVQINRKDEDIETYPEVSRDKYKMFISGSSKDLEIMSLISGFLNEHGYYTWLASRDISPGDNILQKISNAIDESDSMLVVITENSIKNEWVNYEANYAITRSYEDKKIIIPLLIGDVKTPVYLKSKRSLLISDEISERDLWFLLENLNSIHAREAKKGD